MNQPKTITIDDVEYVRADSVKSSAETFEGLEYCIVRTYSAGVYAGYIKKRKGKEATLVRARRLWKWAGAYELGGLAINGTEQGDDCKFGPEVQVLLTEVIEILPCSSTAYDSIQGVAVWQK